MAALKYWLWLAGKKTDRVLKLRLLEQFGSPEAVCCAPPEELASVDGMTETALHQLQDRSTSTAEQILQDCERMDIRILTLHDAEYPERLKNIYDPPIVLYIKGRMPCLDDEACIAVVGTRSCTPYGISCAEKLSYGLAKGGAVVISGLAKGIDAAAGRGALRAGGKTVAVLGCGLDVFYPKENRYLQEDIAARGVLISEYAPGTEPSAKHFPARNRIISGLSSATLVVEAPLKSGAMITAESALEQGRDVYAVPGPIDAESSAGCNRLIREGAGLVTDASDILGELLGRWPEQLDPAAGHAEPAVTGYRETAEAAKAVLPVIDAEALGLTDDQVKILRILPEEGPVSVDDIAEQADLPARRVLSALTILEIDGHVEQHGGKQYTRKVAVK